MKSINLIWSATLVLAVQLTSVRGLGRESVDSAKKRVITPGDCIEATTPANRAYYWGGQLAEYSPDGKKFVVALRKGNLESNSNEYSLYLWNVAANGDISPTRRVIALSSTSNREAISILRWLDNHNVVFLGENPGQLRQLWKLNVDDGSLVRLTDHSSNITSFNISQDLIAFSAEERPGTFFDENARRRGLVVSNQMLSDLISDTRGGETFDSKQELFTQKLGGPERRLQTGLPGVLFDAPIPSPNGKLLLLRTYIPTKEMRSEWEEYQDNILRVWTKKDRQIMEGISGLQRYVILDPDTYAHQVLIEAPMGREGPNLALWSDDGQSVLIAGTYLPLEGTQGAERDLRRSTMFTVRVSIKDQKVIEIARGRNRFEVPVMENHCVRLREEDETEIPGNTSTYCDVNGSWHRAPVATSARPKIVIDEDLNTSPKLATEDKSGNHRIIMDLNPQFADLAFGKVEEIEWKGIDDEPVKGALFYPTEYTAGKRYPLVIQTHGYFPKKFVIDGIFTSNGAAQPFAGRGIMVLQVDESLKDLETSREVPRELASFQGAIKYLDNRGLVDPKRIGIIGFSRTCLHVLNALARSQFNFAAASVADGVDASYFQYTVFSNANLNAAAFDEAINGGKPYGSGLANWVEHSAGFHVHEINTPLLLLAENASALLSDWEFYAGLSRLGRPVELVYTKDGSHQLEKPQDRLIWMEKYLDWFSFWLKDKSPDTPADKERYEHMRDIQRASVKHMFEQDAIQMKATLK